MTKTHSCANAGCALDETREKVRARLSNLDAYLVEHGDPQGALICGWYQSGRTLIEVGLVSGHKMPLQVWRNRVVCSDSTSRRHSFSREDLQVLGSLLVSVFRESQWDTIIQMFRRMVKV